MYFELEGLEGGKGEYFELEGSEGGKGKYDYLCQFNLFGFRGRKGKLL